MARGVKRCRRDDVSMFPRKKNTLYLISSKSRVMALKKCMAGSISCCVADVACASFAGGIPHRRPAGKKNVQALEIWAYHPVQGVCLCMYV